MNQSNTPPAGSSQKEPEITIWRRPPVSTQEVAL